MKVPRHITPRCEQVFACSTETGESPLWDGPRRRLYWVDIPHGTVYLGAPATGRFSTRRAAAPVGSLGRYASGDLLVAAAQLERWRGPFERATVEPLALMPPRPVQSRFNDGKVGPGGAFWVGTVDPRPERGATGAFYRFAAGTQPALLVDQLRVPNGLAWSPAGDRMVFSDSGQGRVWSLPFDPVTGPLAEPQLWLDWQPRSMGMPDGAAMDETGCYWSCGIFAGAIHRFDPAGRHIESYHLPVSQPTMCCFGDDDLRTVYVTSMTARLDGKLRAQEPLAGSVIAFRVECPGLSVESLA